MAERYLRPYSYWDNEICQAFYAIENIQYANEVQRKTWDKWNADKLKNKMLSKM